MEAFQQLQSLVQSQLEEAKQAKTRLVELEAALEEERRSRAALEAQLQAQAESEQRKAEAAAAQALAAQDVAKDKLLLEMQRALKQSCRERMRAVTELQTVRAELQRVSVELQHRRQELVVVTRAAGKLRAELGRFHQALGSMCSAVGWVVEAPSSFFQGAPQPAGGIVAQQQQQQQQQPAPAVATAAAAAAAQRQHQPQQAVVLLSAPQAAVAAAGQQAGQHVANAQAEAVHRVDAAESVMQHLQRQQLQQLQYMQQQHNHHHQQQQQQEQQEQQEQQQQERQEEEEQKLEEQQQEPQQSAAAIVALGAGAAGSSACSEGDLGGGLKRRGSFPSADGVRGAKQMRTSEESDGFEQQPPPTTGPTYASPAPSINTVGAAAALAGLHQVPPQRGADRRGAARRLDSLTDEDPVVWLNRNIKSFVNSLRKERAFEAFKDPVPADTPGYYEAIAKPMDLATIAAKAADEEYGTPEEFKAHMRLVVDNAKAFNPRGHPFHTMADQLWDRLSRKNSFFHRVDDEWQQRQAIAQQLLMPGAS